MNALVRKCRWCALIVLAAAAGACSTTKVVDAAENPFPIREYSQHRSETLERLNEITTNLVPRLRAESREERRLAIRETVAFVREHIWTHAGQVEMLYTYADRLAGPRYTETMRWEHRDLGTTIQFLESLASAPEPDEALFRSQVNTLVNRMWWHIDKETDTIGALVVDNELERQRRAEGRRDAARGSGH